MAFIRNSSGWPVVVDETRGVSISRSVRPWSDTDPIVFGFTYKSEEVSFLFGAVSRTERRVFTGENSEVAPFHIPVAMDVFEPSIRSGLRHASFAFSPEKFEQIKATIKEGIYVLSLIHALKTGDVLNPDLKVNFVTSIEFVNRRSPIKGKADV